MLSIKKSILAKLIAFLSVVSILLILIQFAFLSFELGSVPLWAYALSLFTLTFLFSLFYVFDVIRPMKTVLIEMQSLITGKSYKKIYTERLDELGILAHFFNQVTTSFSRVSEDIKDRDRLVNDLDIASQLQRDVLPPTNPVIKGLQVSAKTKPATELGGDVFNFLNKEGKVYIYIGDVTGHGVAAGLIMTMANALIIVFADIYSGAYEIIHHVNHYLRKHVHKAMFMTMLMLCWDEEKQALSYVGAGHEHMLVFRAKSGECEAIIGGGVALGMVDDNSKLVCEKNVDLSDGDFVVLYSDGIVEAKNSSGDFFGLEQLINLIQEFAPQYSADGVNYHIAKAVSAFMHGSEQLDDMTLIVIKKDSKLSVESGADMTTNWKE